MSSAKADDDQALAQFYMPVLRSGQQFENLRRRVAMPLNERPVQSGQRSRARPGEQAAKRALILAAKNHDCVICRLEGRDASWPPEAMSLDHEGVKRMWFSLGSDKSRRARTGGCPPYTEFTLAEVREELRGCVPVCLNHHATISKNQARKSGYAPQVVDFEATQMPLDLAW